MSWDERKVCSFELSRTLKESGVVQRSFLYWDISWQIDDEWDGKLQSKNAFVLNNNDIPLGIHHNLFYSAFNANELKKLLSSFVFLFWWTNNPDLLAKILIFLLRNKFIKKDSP